MKRNELKPNGRVVDRWFLHWGTGIIERVMKTRVRINFGGVIQSYDNAHLQFLSKALR